MSTQQQPHPGSSIAWKNAPTKSVDVGGTKFVYRQLGPDIGVPVIFLNHLAAELDRWDPRVVDGIATRAASLSSTTEALPHPKVGLPLQWRRGRLTRGGLRRNVRSYRELKF